MTDRTEKPSGNTPTQNQVAEQLIANLTPQQQDELQELLELITAEREGKATTWDILVYATRLPGSDLVPLTEVFQAMRK